MRRMLLYVIGRAVPPGDREWVVGDTLEELAARTARDGAASARRWLWHEALRVIVAAPRHRAAARIPAPLVHAHRRGEAVAALAQDFRYAFRLLGRSRGFAIVAIGTLAIGIGATTAMFAVVNGLLLKPLPFANADRLMLVHLMAPDYENPEIVRQAVWSVPKYRTFAAEQSVFEETGLFAGRDVTVSGTVEPERLRGEIVTAAYPGLLGIQPMLGRPFTQPETGVPGAAAVVMIGHGLWTRRFGADPGVLGRRVAINGTPAAIIGVLPRGFRGLTGAAEIWMPLAVFEASELTQAQSHSYTAIARRKADVSHPAASAAVQQLGGVIDAAHPAERPWGAAAASLYDSRADADVRQAATVLLGAVSFVLLIACVNLTNLVGARAAARRREVGVRVAIGASRGRIVRQFLAEGAVLAAGGALAGLAVAAVLLATVGRLLPDPETFFRTAIAPGTPRIAGAAGLTRIGAAMIGLDGATIALTIGIAALAAVLVSLLPAAQASMLRPIDALKAGAKGLTPRGVRHLNGRSLLVTTQVALALLLLCGAGLMIRSAASLQATDIGVSTDGVLTARVELPRASYTPEKGMVFYAQLLERIRALPGVESAALANCPPVSGGCNGTSFWDPARERKGPGRDPLVGIHWASPDYFETLGIRLVRGRLFTERDRTGVPRAVLASETAARELWPNDDPVGKRAALGQGGFHEGAVVVGVVSDVKYQSLDSVAGRDFYVPIWQSYQPRLRLFVRGASDAAALVGAIRREVQALDPALPLSEIKTLDDRVDDAMWRTRVLAWILSAFAAIALLLTGIGVFGVMAQTVVQRTSEIGIRLALGAARRDVLLLVLRQAAALTGLGLVLGLGSALALSRVLQSLLYGVAARDPLTFALVGLVIGAVALVACYIPARQACRVDAIVALRTE